MFDELLKQQVGLMGLGVLSLDLSAGSSVEGSFLGLGGGHAMTEDLHYALSRWYLEPVDQCPR